MAGKYYDHLGLIVMDNCKELGEKIDKHLMEKRNSSESFIIPKEEVRFSSGEGKIVLKGSTRAKDIYVISDVLNRSMTYRMGKYTNHMSPDDHFQDVVRAISALRGHDERLSVFMPNLYSGRQHKRNGGESLDCPLVLQLLEFLGVEQIITCDAHDKRVENAVSPKASFDDFKINNNLVEAFIRGEQFDPNNIMVIAPDTGALGRATEIADFFMSPVGLFHKRRDYSRVVNGKNPVIAHDYLGSDVKGKTILIADDIISSGGSILETSRDVKERGAEKTNILVTFPLFLDGLEEFDKAYEQGLINHVYSSNLTYSDEELLKRPWYTQVDCSGYAADIIDTLNSSQSVKDLKNGKQKILSLLEEKKKGNL